MNAGAALFVSAGPLPTRNTTNESGPPPPPLELDDEDDEDDEVDDDEDDDDVVDDELSPEDDEELDAPPVPPFPPIPLLETELLAELLEDAAPQSAPSPPWPLSRSGRIVPSAHAATTNGVRANAVKAIVVVERERRKSTAGPFFTGRGSTTRFACKLDTSVAFRGHTL